MRKELEQMDRVERYLAGPLSDQERIDFEMELSKDPGLQELVSDHRLLLRGMERLALRPTINSAYRKYQFLKWAPWIGGAVLVALFAAAVIMGLPSGESTADREIPAADHSEDAAPEGTPPGELPEEQHTLILDAQRETLDTLKPDATTSIATRKEVRTKNGVVPEDEAAQAEDPLLTSQREARDVVLTNEPTVGYISAQQSTQPSFPGGDAAMRKFIYGNLKEPKAPDGTPIDDMVTVRFTVMADGSIDRIRIRTGSHEETRAEAERLIRIMPRWKPATVKGLSVPAEMEFPIVFMSGMQKLD